MTNDVANQRASGYCGLGVCGLASCSCPYTPSTFSGTPSSYIPRPLLIFDASLNRIGEILNYQSVQWISNWYGADTFEIDVIRYNPFTSALQRGNFVQFPSAIGTKWGVIQTVTAPLTSEGKTSEVWKIVGLNVRGYDLTGRRCLNNWAGQTIQYYSCTAQFTVGKTLTGQTSGATGVITAVTPITSTTGILSISTITGTFAAAETIKDNNSTQGVAAIMPVVTTTYPTGGIGTLGQETLTNVSRETALRHLFNVNCIQTYDPISGSTTARTVPGVTLSGGDGMRGGIVSLNLRGELLADQILALEQAAQMHVDEVWTGSGANFIYTPLTGRDVSGAVTLTVNFGNVKGYTWTDDGSSMKNCLYTGGSGSGTSRLLQKIFADIGWYSMAQINPTETAILAMAALVASPNNTMFCGTNVNGLIYQTLDSALDWAYVGRCGTETGIPAICSLKTGPILFGTSPTGKIYSSTFVNGVMSAPVLSQRLGAETSVNTLCDADFAGTVLAGTSPTGYVFQSVNNGQTFPASVRLGTETGVYFLIRMANGNILAGTTTGNTYISSNKGTSFGAALQLGTETGCYCGLDLGAGVVLVGTTNGRVYRSVNYCVAFPTSVQVAAGYNITALSTAGNGIVVAAASNGFVYLSYDGGVTFPTSQQLGTETSIPCLCPTKCVSSDGRYMAAMVAGTGTTGMIYRAGNLTILEPTGRARREDFLDASDCTTAPQLISRGCTQIATTAVVQSLTFDYVPSNPLYTLGTDFTLGDIVTVDDPGIATMVSRIITITELYSKDGPEITLAIGTAKPDMRTLIRKIRTDMAVRQKT